MYQKLSQMIGGNIDNALHAKIVTLLPKLNSLNYSAFLRNSSATRGQAYGPVS